MKNLYFISLLLFFIKYSEAQNSQLPVAVKDTFDIFYLDDTITFNLIKNDYNPDNLSFKLQQAYGSISFTDSTATYYLDYMDFYNKSGIIQFQPYLISLTTSLQVIGGSMVYLNLHLRNNDSININGVNCRINNNGSHFRNLFYPGGNKYEVPKGSNRNAICTYTTWIAGMDENDSLHLAADRYGSKGQDYFPGPITNTICNSTYDSLYNRLWKLNKTEIDYHKTHWWIGGYQVPEAILNWPGNGNTAIGQMAQQAPYYDFNNNGIYEPMAGDYPLIKGDQAIFFILNDISRPHTETGGKPFGLEIHGMAYAFDCSVDSALSYTTFLHYDIFNRSTTTYHDVLLGTFVDIDLGNAGDDYIGCDVGRGSFLGYNADYYHYNDAISATILAGPYFDPDGLDNPKTDQFGNPLCDYSINGANFSDGIIDNERYGMNSFLYMPLMNFPSTPEDYLNEMLGNYMNGDHMQYGSSGVDCNFLFPELSDFCNWGTNGIQPPGYQTGAGGSGAIWSDVNSGNPPDDRKGISSMGPFTFLPGQKQELDMAFVWADNYTDTIPASAVQLLKTRIDQIRYYFQHDSTPCGTSFTGVEQHKKDIKPLRIYPNPANDRLYIEYANTTGKSEYSIYGLAGNLVSAGNLNGSNISSISLENNKPGMYILVIQDGQSLYTRKFIKQ